MVFITCLSVSGPAVPLSSRLEDSHGQGRGDRETSEGSVRATFDDLSSSLQYVSPQPGEGPKSRSLERKQPDPVVLTKWRHSTYLLELNDKVGVEALPIRCAFIPVCSPPAGAGGGSV